MDEAVAHSPLSRRHGLRDTREQYAYRFNGQQVVTIEDFAAAMHALSVLRAPVDAFFDKVLVNSDNAGERENRLKLLGEVRALMGQVADFSQVSG